MSYCFETDGSVLELTSSGLSCSGIVILDVREKALVRMEVRKGVLVLVAAIERRGARVVRVRLLENIGSGWEEGWKGRVVYVG